MKTTTTALILIVLSIASFTRVIAKINKANQANTEQTSNTNDVNVAEVLAAMNIATSVDAAALEAKYPSVQVRTENNTLTLSFSNPDNAAYSLFVYDADGNIVSNKANITGNMADVNLPAAAYTYQLKGAGNIYCGKFLMD